MTQTRSLLLIAWLFVAGWLWLQWSEWNAAPATPAEPAATIDTSLAPPAVPLPAAGATPSTDPTVLPPAPALPGAPSTGPATATAAAPVVRVRNDVLELEIDGRGSVIGSRLLGYREEKRDGSPQVRLL